MSKEEILKELERRREFTHRIFVVRALPNPYKGHKEVVNKEIEFLDELIKILKKEVENE
jgi:hypothetical protein